MVGGDSSTSDVGISVATSGIGETGDLDHFGGQLTLSKARAQVLCDRLAVNVFLRMVPVAPGRVASAPAPPAVTRLARPWGSEPTENQTIPAGPVETAPAYQDPEKEVFRCRPCEPFRNTTKHQILPSRHKGSDKKNLCLQNLASNGIFVAICKI